MDYRGHLVGGALAAAGTVAASPVEAGALAACGAAALAGSLAPDIDHPGSYLGRRLRPVTWLLRLLLSNPLTWWMAGPSTPGERRVTSRRKLSPFVWLTTHTPLHRAVASPDRALRWATRMELGRERQRALTAHRALTHSLVGTTALTVLFAPIAYLLAATVAAHVPELWAWTRGGLVGGPWLDRPLWAVTLWSVVGFHAGQLSHLLLDMMTARGVPLLLPRSDVRVRLVPWPPFAQTS